jgi:hypothetical protein
MLDKNQSKTLKISNQLFLLIKNVKDDIESFKTFSRAQFIKYILKYNPGYFDRRAGIRWLLEGYSRDFIGIFDYNDLER